MLSTAAISREYAKQMIVVLLKAANWSLSEFCTENADGPAWLNEKEAVGHIKVSEGKFRQMVNAGKITRYRLSAGMVRFDRRELDALFVPMAPTEKLHDKTKRKETAR